MGTATDHFVTLAASVASAFGRSVTVRYSSGATFSAASGEWSGTVSSVALTADEQEARRDQITTASGKRIVMETRVYLFAVADVTASALGSDGIKKGMTVIGTDSQERPVTLVDRQVDGRMYRVTTRREARG